MKKTIWALFDDRVGSVNQAKGIIQALGNEYDVTYKHITYNRWASLPNCLLGASKAGISKDCPVELSQPYPDIILSVSRRTTPIARYLKRKSQGKSKIVQLMYPGNCGIKELDLIIASQHDAAKCKNGNIFLITGCPHRITPKELELTAEKWKEAFTGLPAPRTAVIIGGAIKGKPFSEENARNLGLAVKTLYEKTGGSLLITTSRRTGSTAEALIKEQVKDIPAYTYWWGEEKENPLMAFLALSDRIVVTGDSVSMCSEACGTGKPVLVFCGRNWLTPKHYRFVNSLYEGGFATALEDEKALAFTPRNRLDPASEAAEKIKELF